MIMMRGKICQCISMICKVMNRRFTCLILQSVVILCAGYALAGTEGGAPNYDTYYGQSAGFSVIGQFNSFFGAGAGGINTGSYNSFVGKDAGTYNQGSYNIFFGTGAGNSNEGDANSFLGYEAGNSNKGGFENTYVGYHSGYLSTGNANVFLGLGAGYSELGSNKLYIDNCVTGNTDSTGGWCTQPLIKGEFDTRNIWIDGTVTMITVATPSDVRYKEDIATLESSLKKIMLLRGVSYAWKQDRVKGAGFKEGRNIGFIAQEVETVLPELVHRDSKGYMTLSYDKVVPVLVEAIKEQQAIIEDQKRKSEEKDSRINKLEEEIAAIGRRMDAIEVFSKKSF